MVAASTGIDPKSLRAIEERLLAVSCAVAYFNQESSNFISSEDIPDLLSCECPERQIRVRYANDEITVTISYYGDVLNVRYDPDPAALTYSETARSLAS